MGLDGVGAIRICSTDGMSFDGCSNVQESYNASFEARGTTPLECELLGHRIDLLLPSAIHRTVRKNAIANREIQDRSPMPEGLIQTPAELRDLLAFLLSQK